LHDALPIYILIIYEMVKCKLPGDMVTQTARAVRTFFFGAPKTHFDPGKTLYMFTCVSVYVIFCVLLCVNVCMCLPAWSRCTCFYVCVCVCVCVCIRTGTGRRRPAWSRCVSRCGVWRRASAGAGGACNNMKDALFFSLSRHS